MKPDTGIVQGLQFIVENYLRFFYYQGLNSLLLHIIILILATILITWLISQYQMDFPHRPVRPRRVRTVARARLHQQAVWFLYVATITFSTAVGLLTELIRQIVRSHDLETEKADKIQRPAPKLPANRDYGKR